MEPTTTQSEESTAPVGRMPAFRHARLPACRHARVPVLRCSSVATFRPALRCCGVAAFEKKCVDGSVAGSAWRRVPPTGLRLHMTRFRRGGTSVCEFSYSRAAVPTMARRQACVVCVSGCSGIPVASQGPWWAGGKSSGTRFCSWCRPVGLSNIASHLPPQSCVMWFRGAVASRPLSSPAATG